MFNQETNSDLCLFGGESAETVPSLDTDAGLRVGFSFMEGWIKLHRKIRDNWIWQDPQKFQWWIDILLEVNHMASKIPIGFELIECGRGQSIRSLQGWAERWRVSKGTARNFLSMLESDGMITHESLKKTTRITVCNYETYQMVSHDDKTVTERSLNDDKTPSYPNKKEKKEKNVKNEKKVIGENSPYYKICVEIYFDEYQKLTGVKPTFSKAEGSNLKQLIPKIENSMRQNSKEINDESVAAAFRTLLVKLPTWFKERMDIKLINSKYDAIITEIRSKSSSGDSWAKILEERQREREEIANGN